MSGRIGLMLAPGVSIALAVASQAAQIALIWVTKNVIDQAIRPRDAHELWVFVWMIDQARMRGKNVWVWLVPFVLAPLPTLMLFVLFLQRRIQSS